MQYQPKDFFAEHEEADVDGFVVIEADEQAGYRVAEKWEPDDRETEWLTYWVPQESLEHRATTDRCSHIKQASDEQFEGILKLTGLLSRYKDEIEALA